MGKTAVIFGATGLVGSQLLKVLLNAKEFEKVIVVSRKSTGINDPKLDEILIDYNSIDQLKGKFTADVAFCTLGTTRKKTPDQNLYYRIEHDYSLASAQLSKANGVTQFFYNSSINARLNAQAFYLKTKAETERDLDEVAFDQYVIYRPSFITGKRSEKRLAEDISKWILKFLNPFLIGKMKKYRSISAEKIAYSMYLNSLTLKRGKQVLESDQIS